MGDERCEACLAPLSHIKSSLPTHIANTLVLLQRHTIGDPPCVAIAAAAAMFCAAAAIPELAG